jgi:NADPH:quinone reductase-like Zn-dependent oxidoreductase
VVGNVTSIAGVLDEETAGMMGIEGYQLPEDLDKMINKKSANYKFTWMQPDGAQLDAISTLVKNGEIKPVIDATYSFEDGIDAYSYLATGSAKGKVIIRMA